MDALQKGLTEIETIRTKIKTTDKQEYLNNEHDNFSRLMHDYSDVKSGFTVWKGMMEEGLV